MMRALFLSGNCKLILALARNCKLAREADSLFGDVSDLSMQLGTAVAQPNKSAAREQIRRTEEKLDRLIENVKAHGNAIGDAIKPHVDPADDEGDE